MAGDTANPKLHVAFFPWLAFGHINPYLELAKFIAQKGHKVSFLSSPRNIQRLPEIPSHLENSIDLVSLPVVHSPKLPENAESTMDIPPDKSPHLGRVCDSLKQPIYEFLEANCPDWILYDFAAGWLPEIADELGLSHGYFSIIPSWNVAFFGAPRSGSLTEPPNWITFPTSLAIKPFELKRLIDLVKAESKDPDDRASMTLSFAGCQVMLIRDCFELEAEWFDLVSQIFNKSVIPVGVLPSSLFIKNEETKEDDDANWLQISQWLDTQPKTSVVYIAFGSESVPDQGEVGKLAAGLELSGLPFFWVFKKTKSTSSHSDLVELPEGFEERTSNQGIVWTSWAPQQKILSHESIGGFVTHCGWSSILESIHYGRPVIMFPLTVEQALNARILGEKKLGMEVPRDDEDGSFSSEMVAEILKMVIVNEDGKVYRNRVAELSKVFTDKERHEKYIDDLLKFFQDHKCRKNSLRKYGCIDTEHIALS